MTILRLVLKDSKNEANGEIYKASWLHYSDYVNGAGFGAHDKAGTSPSSGTMRTFSSVVNLRRVMRLISLMNCLSSSLLSSACHNLSDIP